MIVATTLATVNTINSVVAEAWGFTHDNPTRDNDVTNQHTRKINKPLS